MSFPVVPGKEYGSTAVHDVRVFMKGIHGYQVDRKEKAFITLSTRLYKILAIVRKL